MICEAHPDDCPNGPQPHEFIPDIDITVDWMPCCRQPWEATVPYRDANDNNLWALDLADNGNPERAHRIARVHGDGCDQVRVTACGLQLDRTNHPNGWWSVAPGELPLAEVSKIHCGLQPVEILP